MASSPSRSTSNDPSIEGIEDRVAVYDPEWEDATEDEDDDDMDYEPAVEDADEEEEELFEDAPEELDGLEIEFEVADEEEGQEEGQESAEAAVRTGRPVFITRDRLMQLVRQPGLRRLLLAHSGGSLDDSDSDDGVYRSWSRRTPRRGANRERAEFEKVPSDQGRDLMIAGNFGSNERMGDRIHRKKKLTHRLLRRELGLGSWGQQRARNALMKQDLIPSSKADAVITYGTRCYSGQFSNDGNFFFSCGQDFKVRMYDTSNPYRWKYYKMVDNPYGSWTITDASLSSDNKWLAYSSISSIVCLAPTDPNDNSSPRTLDFARMGNGRGGTRGYTRFGIWSIRFSGDGREIVAGTGDRSVYVFDIERNQSILRIPGHQDDVNAVCFGDAASPHILYSGSDDTTLKVWDRRSLGEGRAAGVFLGHTEGLTYVDSKGDGRYIISNGKDQTAKLWDLRKVIPTEDADKININQYTTGFEYRRNPFNFDEWQPHPHDCSLVTFRGHQVIKTLIRCHFSPPGSTDSRYVYSGSYDGKVYIWNLDATLKGVIDVGEATSFLRSMQREDYDDGFWENMGFNTCVRDASWHPDVPMIAATSWNGWGSSMGTCTVHSWNDGLDEDDGEPRMGVRLQPRLEPEEEEGVSWFSRRRARRRW